MAHSQEDDPLAGEHRTGSEDNLVDQTPPRRSSNSKALKIAGLTTLACLLLSSQIVTAYMVFDQGRQIHGLRQASEKLGKDVLRSSRVKTPMKINMPMNSLALDFSVDADTAAAAAAAAAKQPETQQQDASASRTNRRPTDAVQDAAAPGVDASFLESVRSLRRQMNETEWQIFQAWVRDRLVHQRSRHQPAPPPPQPDGESLVAIKTRCQAEASADTGGFSAFRPKCDEQGRYHPKQCWHATGFCWCVDETGTVVEGSSSRDQISCGE